ncbi:hypothetical protein N7449_009001 [Penicillium cf. viridicatum]|uniref:Uncharacterized protein n=1 Tax=Penicillium cf. viridicatum TaxID=2972119 RepID=A0A9W9JAI6_9EURO|nr:hypothetical protein N7449_009001 [Penicillium cf. viridicatum]
MVRSWEEPAEQDDQYYRARTKSEQTHRSLAGQRLGSSLRQEDILSHIPLQTNRRGICARHTVGPRGLRWLLVRTELIKVEVYGDRPVGYLRGNSTSSPYTQKLEYIPAEPRVELKNNDLKQINDYRPPSPTSVGQDSENDSPD